MGRQIELLAIDDLVSADVNPKDHDMATLDDSLTRFGYVEPIVRDDRTGKLVSGHGRTAAIRARLAAGAEPPEGVEIGEDGRWYAPVMTGWASKNDDDAGAAVIALNRIGERGGWQKDPLAEMLAGLADTDSGLLGVGYDRADLDDLLASIQENPNINFDPADPYAAAGAESSYDDWANNYRNKQVRSMVFDYPLDDYNAVVALAGEARKAYGVESNAELFAVMLQRWKAEIAGPEPDEPTPTVVEAAAQAASATP